jgi:hypothetical protein
MIVQVANANQRIQRARVQVAPAEARSTVLVIRAEVQRHCAATMDLILQIGHECPAHTAPPPICTHDERMELPRESAIGGDSANPSDNRTRVVQRYAADATFLK